MSELKQIISDVVAERLAGVTINSREYFLLKSWTGVYEPLNTLFREELQQIQSLKSANERKEAGAKFALAVSKVLGIWLAQTASFLAAGHEGSQCKLFDVFIEQIKSQKDLTELIGLVMQKGPTNEI